MTYDLAINNGTIVDGTGAPRYQANLGILGGRIAAISKEPLKAKEDYDARGLIAAPGFVDVHSHGDLLPLLIDDYRNSRLKQGITLELAGQCGIGPIPYDPLRMEAYKAYVEPVIGRTGGDWNFRDLDSLSAALEGRMPHNIAYLIGLGALRSHICGLDPRALTSLEIDEMARLYEEQLDQGALGLSLGLSYLPGVYARPEELHRLAAVTARRGALLMAHIRSHGKDMPEAMEEYVDLSRRTGCRIHISHCRSFKNRDFGISAGETLALAERMREEGIDLTLDQHPYTAGSTFLNQLLPPQYRDHTRYGEEALLEEIEGKISDKGYTLPGWDNFSLMVGFDNIYLPKYGATIGKLARESAATPFRTLIDILIREQGNATMVIREMFSLEDTSRLLHDPKTYIGSDGLPSGRPHPRLYGAFPKVIATYVREQGALSLEEAIRRMTGADLLGFPDRGEIGEGKIADLTLFDEEQIGHEESYSGPNEDPTGIRAVFLAGRLSYDGTNILAANGRVLKGTSGYAAE